MSDIQVGEISHLKTLKTKYSVNLGSLAAGLTLGGLYTSKFLQTHGGYRSQGLSFAKLASCLFCCVVVPVMTPASARGLWPRSPA